MTYLHFTIWNERGVSIDHPLDSDGQGLEGGQCNLALFVLREFQENYRLERK